MPNEPNTFGQVIKEGRKKLNLSQHQLAFVAGVSQPAVSRIEAGIQTPFLNQAWILIHVLKINMEDVNSVLAEELARAEERLKNL